MFEGATTTRSCSGRSSIYDTLIWVILFAFALRIAVRWYTGASDFWENGYSFFFALAQDIAAGNWPVFRVPLYPMFLAAVTFGHQTFLAVLVAQSLIGAGTVWCAAMLAREMFGNTAAIIAAILTAIYPYYVVHDTALQETSLYTFLMAAAVLLLLRARRSASEATAAGAGLALGAAVLTRANLAPFALFAPLWLALAGGAHAAPRRRRLYAAVLCASVGVLAVSPWLIRSYLFTGSVTLSGQSGFFLWLGNNPYTFSRYPEESIDRSQEAAIAALSSQDKKELEIREPDKTAVDQWFQQKGLAYIREHPWRTLGNSVWKIVDAFGWLPSPRRSFWPNLVHVLSYGPVMILGIWWMLISSRHWREHSIFYAQFIAFAAVTAVFFGHTSYRAYLDVYWIVFAAGGLAAWISKYHLAASATSASVKSSNCSSSCEHLRANHAPEEKMT
jgi:4-amino-4-deoxy-L-arabinose transferase-like glycosyltransferase